MSEPTLWWLVTGAIVVAELLTGTFYLLMLGLGAVAAALAAHLGASLTGFELMSRFSVALVTSHYPQMRLGFSQAYPQYVLFEISDGESEEHATAMLEALVAEAMEQTTSRR